MPKDIEELEDSQKLPKKLAVYQTENNLAGMRNELISAKNNQKQ